MKAAITPSAAGRPSAMADRLGARPGKRRLDFLMEPLWLRDITRTKKEGHHALDTGTPGKRSSLRGGQVQLPRGDRGILIEERGFDEELIGIACEFDDASGVGGMIDGVHHVDNPFARFDMQYFRFQLTQRERPLRAPVGRDGWDRDERAIRFASSNRLLEVREPGTNRQPEAPNTILPDIDAELFLEREGETGYPVIEPHGPHAAFLVVEQDTVLDDRRCHIFTLEGIARVKFRGHCQRISMQLR